MRSPGSRWASAPSGISCVAGCPTARDRRGRRARPAATPPRRGASCRRPLVRGARHQPVPDRDSDDPTPRVEPSDRSAATALSRGRVHERGPWPGGSDFSATRSSRRNCGRRRSRPAASRARGGTARRAPCGRACRTTCESPPSLTARWAVSTSMSLVNVQTWRSWTPLTPSIPASAALIASRSVPAGAAWTSTRNASRPRRHARGQDEHADRGAHDRVDPAPSVAAITRRRRSRRSSRACRPPPRSRRRAR